MLRNIGMLAALGIIEPYVACDGRSVVLAPFILIALAVLIEEAPAVLGKAQHLNGCSQHLQGTAALHGHLVQLGQRAGGEHHTGCRVLNLGSEHHPLAVWREGLRHLCITIIGKAGGRTAFGRHHKDIQITVPVAGKGYLTSVGTPHGAAFITVLRGQLHCRSALGRYLIYIPFVAKENLCSVRTHLNIPQP